MTRKNIVGIINTRPGILGGAVALGLIAAGLYLAIAATAFDPDASTNPAGYVGQPAVTSPIVKSGNERMFVIDYASQDWSGNLHAYNIAANGTVSGTDNWVGGAQAQIDAQDWDAGRVIVTRSDAAGIPFRWARLTSSQKSALDAATAADAAASPLLNYLRGDASNQMASATALAASGSNWRYRAHKLGDIIHSTPVYCPATDCTAETVFVGANDGMLHAINATDGSERFAYIPSMLLPKLGSLKEAAFAHRHFVDGRVAVRKFGSRTLLAGALGAGGKGLFGLDVSNAAPAGTDNAAKEASAASKVLWEITPGSAGFANLGNIYGQPTLANLQTATGTSQAVLVTGNGYNGGGTGTAVLYLIDPASGTLIKAIDTGSGSAASPNGLSAPSLWASGTYGAGITDTAYAGDIDGNLWKFDLVGGTAIKLFASGQAITAAPGLMKHPLGGVMITFATGRLLTASDKVDTATFCAYGIWDQQYMAAPSPAIADADLLAQTLQEAAYTGTTPNLRMRWATDNAPNWGIHKGWKTPLPTGGERVVGDGAYITDGVFQFVSTNPTVNTASKPYGENWWMQLNALTGGDNGRTLMDLNHDGLFTSADQITVGSGATAVNRDPVGRHVGGGGASQLIALTTTGPDVYQGNYDRNDWPSTTTSSSTTTVARGVSGGHFDFEFYCNPETAAASCFSNAHTSPVTSSDPNIQYNHTHEYDDIYDKTGVDMLNPSKSSLALLRALGGVTRTIDSGPTTVSDGSTTTNTATHASTGQTSYSNDVSQTSSSSTSSGTAGYPQTAFTTQADGSLLETVTEKNSTTTTSTRKYTDGTYYACPSNRKPDRKCYYIYQDVSQTVEDKTTTTVVKYAYGASLAGFRILVANQGYSPAVELTIGDENATATKSYNFQTASGLHLDAANFNASFPAYTLKSLRHLKFNLPINGFEAKKWNANGTDAALPSMQTRSGLHPTVPDCVVSTQGTAPVKGPEGEWRNGALTIQIVKADTTAADIRENVTGKPELGYVLKESSYRGKMIAEYSSFWHAPKHSASDTSSHVNGGHCMAETGWNMAPPQDNTSDASPATPASGSSDPYVGTYGVGGSGNSSGGGTVTNTATSVAINTDAAGNTITTTTTVRTYSDGSTSTTVTTTTTGSGSGIGTAQFNRQSRTLGRINWREFLR